MPKDFFEENRTKIEKISKKLKNKKVIIYGTGKLFQFLKSENVFSDWDVVGVCDINTCLKMKMLSVRVTE